MTNTTDDKVFQEVIEALVDLAGTADRAADWMGVTPQAISGWRRGGGASESSARQARQMVLRYRARYLFICGWLFQRTLPVRVTEMSLVVERAAGDALTNPPADDDSGTCARWFMPFTKPQRQEIVRTLVRAYMADDLLVDGDVLVFFSPDATTFIYPNTENVAVSFERRDWEPWWALRQFTGK